MAKKLVKAGSVKEFICKDTGKFYAQKDMILTPGAKDELREMGVKIEYGPKPEVKKCDKEEITVEKPVEEEKAFSLSAENILLGIAAILKNEYGITDPDQLMKVSIEVVNIIKENL